MIMFIEKSKKINLIKKWFKRVELCADRIIINDDFKNIKLKKKIKVVDKIKEIAQKNNCGKVVVSKSLKSDGDFINLLYSKNIEVVDGRQLFKMYVPEIVSHIVKNFKMKISDCKIAILSNDYNRFIEKVIKELSSQCKFLNVVTYNAQSFERLEEALRKDGIVINISNNKRKSLISSDIILNFDFPGDVLNMYNIYDNAILVNFEEEIKIRKKRFNGKIFNWYELETKGKEDLFGDKLETYDFNEIAEYLYYMGELDFDKIYLKKIK